MSCFLANRSRPSVFEFPFLFSNGYALFHFPYPVSPVFATLTKTAGCVPTIPILELASRQSSLENDSSSFFSHSCALFCTPRNANAFIFKHSRTLCAKHPGWGVGLWKYF